MKSRRNACRRSRRSGSEPFKPMAERQAVRLVRARARLRRLREIRVEGREDLSVPGRTLATKP
jgi:hypothetical protein